LWLNSLGFADMVCTAVLFVLARHLWRYVLGLTDATPLSLFTLWWWFSRTTGPFRYHRNHRSLLLSIRLFFSSVYRFFAVDWVPRWQPDARSPISRGCVIGSMFLPHRARRTALPGVAGTATLSLKYACAVCDAATLHDMAATAWPYCRLAARSAPAGGICVCAGDAFSVLTDAATRLRTHAARAHAAYLFTCAGGAGCAARNCGVACAISPSCLLPRTHPVYYPLPKPVYTAATSRSLPTPPAAPSWPLGHLRLRHAAHAPATCACLPAFYSTSRYCVALAFPAGFAYHLVARFGTFWDYVDGCFQQTCVLAA